MRKLYILILLLFSCNSKIKENAKILIKSLDTYKKEKGYLPKSLSELGFSEKPLYYNKVNDTIYELYFVEGLDKSTVYNSKTKKWRVTTQ